MLAISSIRHHDDDKELERRTDQEDRGCGDRQE